MIKKIINFFKFKKKITPVGELWGWLLWIWKKDSDYILGWDSNLVEKIKNIKPFNRQPRYEYNQWAQDETRNWCTIYSAMTELSYLFDYKFTLCQIQEIWHLMIKDKLLNPDKGAYLSDAIDYTRRWWNKNFPESTVSSYTFSYLDESIWDYWSHVFNKQYRFLWLTQLWYRTSAELHRELQSNWYASKKDYPKVGWHAVSTYWLNIIDNYFWKNKKNRYSFQYFNDLVNNDVIFEDGYIFLKD